MDTIRRVRHTIYYCPTCRDLGEDAFEVGAPHEQHPHPCEYAAYDVEEGDDEAVPRAAAWKSLWRGCIQDMGLEKLAALAGQPGYDEAALRSVGRW